MERRQSVPEVAVERSRRGVTLEQIRETTKIGLFFLQAIENGEFHKLPGGIYSTSYIRQYAQAAGVDANPLLQHYRATMQPGD
ncbi:MAG: helix-turn-helix domain-containing protein [Bryobacterales bacterium]|jgi:cytoskeletal protein RodZ|nr:helix-turn-helix domain-containing protein [Bryobacterales bacterium]